jgi:hypothetical protein
MEGLENQLAEKEQVLEELAVENIRLVAARESDLLRLGPDDFVRAVGAMVEPTERARCSRATCRWSSTACSTASRPMRVTRQCSRSHVSTTPRSSS